MNQTFRQESPWDIKIYMYVSFIFHTQINRNSKKCIILIILILSQFTAMYVPKNLKNAPAQVLTQLRHCIFSFFLHSDRAMKHTKEITLFFAIDNARVTDSITYQYGQIVFFFRFLCLRVIDNASALFSASLSLIYPIFS